MFTGCDKFQGFWVKEITSGMLYVTEHAGKLGVYDVHFVTIDTPHTQPLHQYARIAYTDAKVKLHFDSCTYLEVIEYFKTMNYTWECQVYDKDGNQLFCGEDIGTIAYVKDAAGNVIWTAPAGN
jgi:hypothetical protein